VLHDNEAMRALMRDFGFAVSPSPEQGVFRVTLMLADSSPVAAGAAFQRP
jgi:hypothetical protein